MICVGVRGAVEWSGESELGWHRHQSGPHWQAGKEAATQREREREREERETLEGEALERESP